MSAQHVDLMNRRLVDLADVREACAGFDDVRVMLFHLHVDDRSAVFWCLEYGDTLQLRLADHPAPAVVLEGSWSRMISAVRAGREGKVEDPGLELRGDAELFGRLNAIFELARSAITVETELPSSP